MSSDDQRNTVHHHTDATLEQFWKAMDIWNTSSHVVNRRLCGVICLFIGRILDSDVDHDIIVSKIRDASIPSITSLEGDYILKTLEAAGIQTQKDYSVSEMGVYICIKKLLPRNNEKFQPCLELVVLG
jgi:hypothetical protein